MTSQAIKVIGQIVGDTGQTTSEQILDATIVAADIADATITNAKISSDAAIAWSKVSKTSSSLADLATRSAADLNSGILPDARLSGTLPKLDAAQTWTAAQTFTTGLLITPDVVSSGATITFPTSATTLVGRTTTDTLTNKTLTSPVINGATTLSLDSAGTGNLIIETNSNLTADRTLQITTGDVGRTVTLSGNLNIAGDLITSGANGLILTTTGATNVTLPTTGTLITDSSPSTLTNKTLGTTTFSDAANIILDANIGTRIGTATGQKLGFYNATPVARQAALTAALTQITFSEPAATDFAIASVSNVTPFGFTTANEGNTVMKVINNLQVRVDQLESRLQSYGLL